MKISRKIFLFITLFSLTLLTGCGLWHNCPNQPPCPSKSGAQLDKNQADRYTCNCTGECKCGDETKCNRPPKTIQNDSPS